MTPMEQRVLERLNGRWRKARALGLAKDARKLIQPLKGLVEAGLVERRKEGQDYEYRRKEANEVTHNLPDRMDGESDVEYALRAVKALEAFLAPPPDPMPDVVRHVAQLYVEGADETGLEAAVNFLRRFIDEYKT